MEIRNLITFVSIVEHNNFTRAAESLGYSQTAVTVQMRQLENELGAKLFDRLGRSIRLTQAGNAFYPKALSVLKAADEARASIRDTENPRGELRIGTTSSLAEEVLTSLAVAYVRKYPAVHYDVRIVNEPAPLFDALKRGEVDAVYYMDEKAESDKWIDMANCDITFEQEEPVVFIAHCSSPLADMSEITLEKIAEQPLVVSEREPGYFERIERAMDDRGIRMVPSISIGSVSAIIKIICGGYGVAYVPEFMAREKLRSGEIVILNVKNMPAFSVYGRLVVSRNRWMSPALSALVNEFAMIKID